MRPNRRRGAPFQPLSFTRVTRQRTECNLSAQAESLVNLFSHTYDHSYEMLHATDNIERITHALQLSMEAVAGARTARSSQEEAEDGNGPFDIDGTNQQPNDGEDHEDDDEEGAVDDTERPHPVTQGHEGCEEESHTTDGDARDGSSFNEGDSSQERDRPYSEGSSASRDLTDSEYDDDVSEISIPN